MLQRVREALSRRGVVLRKVELRDTRMPGHIPYTTRYVVYESQHGRIFLNHLRRPDPMDIYHRHQWDHGYSVVLAGGYTERVCLPIRDTEERAAIGSMWEHSYFPGEVNTLQGEEFHRIIKVLPNTWTLLVAGRVTKKMSFLAGSVYRDWIDHQKPETSLDLVSSDQV